MSETKSFSEIEEKFRDLNILSGSFDVKSRDGNGRLWSVMVGYNQL